MTKGKGLVLPGVPNLGPNRTSKALCIMTAALAFICGVVIGVMIPFCVLPAIPREIDSTTTTNFVGRRNVSDTSPLLSKMYPDVTGDGDSRTGVSGPQPLVRSNAINDVLSEQRTNDVESPVTSPDKVRWSVSFVPPSVAATPRPAYKHVSTTTTAQPQPQRNGTVVDGIFWADGVEALLPSGFDDSVVEEWRSFCKKSVIIKMEEGCGRMQNRLVTLNNGTRSCCRYRQNHDQIQGEIFSFYLGRILSLQNLPASTLSLVKPRDEQWISVRSQLSLAQWAEDRPIVLTRFLENIVPAYIPQPFRPSNRHLTPVDLQLMKFNVEDDRDALVELAQWSDLIVFDYLTANLDRIVNNLYNLQWNPTMLEAPAHNLARDPNSGLLIFLDNESGLLHGYRLLDKYESYHRTMLDSLCVFRRSTVDAIRRLHDAGDVGDLLLRMFQSADADVREYLPMLPDRNIRTLKSRIAAVHEHIQKCERLYS